MKITFQNFAKAGKGTVDLKDLTVIYGPNNTGKTYVNYLIFSILENMESYFYVNFEETEIQKFLNDFVKIGTAEFNLTRNSAKIEEAVSNIEKNVESEIHRYFSLPEEYFSKTKISLEFKETNLMENMDGTYGIIGGKVYSEFLNINGERKIRIIKNTEGDSTLDESIKNTKFFNIVINRLIFLELFKNVIYYPFAVTSERTGISLFYKLFEKRNNDIVDLIGASVDEEDKEYKIHSVIEGMQSVHASPIQHNIELIRFKEEYYNRKSAITREPKKYKSILKLLSVLLDGGEFKSQNGSIFYHPHESEEDNFPIPLHAVSSSLKALYSMDVFIKHVATPRHILIIDEPELNLHPENQKLMARLVAKLINCGIKVMVTTHSDYFVCELNNLIKLGKADKKYKKEVMKEFGIEEDEILDFHRVSAYNSTKNRILEEEPVDEYGMDSKMFDEIIVLENKRKQDIQLIMEDD